MSNSFKYLYGPVHSWRLGRSLGIDPLSSTDKICNMDCVYCQLGVTTKLVHTRHEYVKTEEILEELQRIPKYYVDYLTFSGRGEPTLAKNLGEIIRGIKKVRHEKIAVITNSSLMKDPEVQQDLLAADFVLAKLDAFDQESFVGVDGPCGLDYESIVAGIGSFREKFQGKLALQVMLINENIENVAEIASVARKLNADEVQLNTAFRPCAVRPLERVEIEWAKKFFGDMTVVSPWDSPVQEYQPMDVQATIKRHGNYRKTRYGY